MAPPLSLTQLSYTAAGLLATPPNRLDGRGLLAYRPLTITTGVSVQAAGSAECILAGSTRCMAVVSADVVSLGDDDDADVELLECSIEVQPAMPASANLAALVSTLQSTLAHTLRMPSTTPVPAASLVIVRSPHAPHRATRAWRLSVDVTLADVSGGNVADAVMACVYAAVQDVRLPSTRAIGFDANEATKQDGDDARQMDIFDVRGSLTRTRGGGGEQGGRGAQATASAMTPHDAATIGVDFEMLDTADATHKLQQAAAFPIGVTVNVLQNGALLLDATPTEEACIPYTRRLFVLYSAATGCVVGTHMLTASLETGANHLGEERNGGTERVITSAGTGTCDYKTVQSVVRNGVDFAKALHAAIQAQLQGNQMQT